MLFHQLLRACSKPLPVSIVGVVSLPLQNSDAERSITLTGHQSGDLLIAMIANQKDLVSPVPLPAPWTSILTAENDRLLRLSYKIATAGSDTISWLGNCGYLLALRNASAIGIFNTYAFGTSSSTQPIPALSGLDTSGTSLVLAGGRHSSTIAADAPFQLLYPPETPADACAVFVPENTASDLSGKTFTTQRPSLRSNYAIEILG